jgi:VanZ family protein
MIKKNRIAARIVSSLAVLACMAGIFIFSSQEAPESSAVSGSFIEMIAPAICPGFSEMSAAERDAFVENMQGAVRTAAHGTVYLILGVLTAVSLFTYGFPPLKAFLLALLICVGYAVSDEIHQYFVPGSSMQLIDVAVDAAGSLIGSGVLSVSAHLIKVRRRG